MAENSSNAYMTNEEVAALFGVSVSTVYSMVSEGQLRRVPFGKRKRFLRREVEAVANGIPLNEQKVTMEAA